MSNQGYVIVCQGLAGRTFTHQGKPPPKGQYLANYDPEAHGGLGDADWTQDLDKAMRFPDQIAAFRCWTSVPRRRPTRPDGQPNKPLTAFAIEVAPVNEDGTVSDTLRGLGF